MKKLSIILAIILCLSPIFAVQVSAAKTPEARLYVKTRGTVVDVTLKTTDYIGALQGAIKYDASSVEYDEALANGVISAHNEPANSFSNSNGVTKLALVGDPSDGIKGEWATFTYSADVTTPVSFEFTAVKAFEYDGTKIDNIVAKVIRPGDLNEDNFVNIKDYVRIKLRLANHASDPSVTENRDVDMNGNFNTIDCMQLRKDLLGL